MGGAVDHALGVVTESVNTGVATWWKTTSPGMVKPPRVSRRVSEYEASTCCSSTMLLVGNPGTGKSTLLNCYTGIQMFKSGFAEAGTGVTETLQVHVHEGRKYGDTPGLSDIKKRQQAAKEIGDGLKMGGEFVLVFVVVLSAGRIVADDITTIKLVLEACADQIKGNDYAVFINKNRRRALQKINKLDWQRNFYQACEEKGIPTTTHIHFAEEISELVDEDDALVELPLPSRTFLDNLPIVAIQPERVQDVNINEWDELKRDMEERMAKEREQHSQALSRRSHEIKRELQETMKEQKMRQSDAEDRLHLQVYFERWTKHLVASQKDAAKKKDHEHANMLVDALGVHSGKVFGLSSYRVEAIFSTILKLLDQGPSELVARSLPRPHGFLDNYEKCKELEDLSNRWKIVTGFQILNDAGDVLHTEENGVVIDDGPVDRRIGCVCRRICSTHGYQNWRMYTTGNWRDPVAFGPEYTNASPLILKMLGKQGWLPCNGIFQGYDLATMIPELHNQHVQFPAHKIVAWNGKARGPVAWTIDLFVVFNVEGSELFRAGTDESCQRGAWAYTIDVNGHADRYEVCDLREFKEKQWFDPRDEVPLSLGDQYM